MPFFHIALDLVQREWITVEASSLEMAKVWARDRAAQVYEDCYGLGGADRVEFSNVLVVPPGKEDQFTIEARLTDNGIEISNA
jgi:hypothetical protein